MHKYKVGEVTKEALPGQIAYRKQNDDLDEYSGGARRKQPKGIVT